MNVYTLNMVNLGDMPPSEEQYSPRHLVSVGITQTLWGLTDESQHMTISSSVGSPSFHLHVYHTQVYSRSEIQIQILLDIKKLLLPSSPCSLLYQNVNEHQRNFCNAKPRP